MNFDVMGMSCAACSSHVQKAVESVEGVKNIDKEIKEAEKSNPDKNRKQEISR